MWRGQAKLDRGPLTRLASLATLSHRERVLCIPHIATNGRYTGAIDPRHLEPDPSALDLDRLLLIVTGSHLRAETCDRPLAYSLKAEIERRLADAFSDDPPFRVVVCSDLWRINSDELASVPTISIGGPGVSAWAAQLADRLPSAFVIEDALLVQADVEFADLNVSCWGMDHASTVAAVDAYIRKYLPDHLRALLRRVGADDE